MVLAEGSELTVGEVDAAQRGVLVEEVIGDKDDNEG